MYERATSRHPCETVDITRARVYGDCRFYLNTSGTGTILGSIISGFVRFGVIHVSALQTLPTDMLCVQGELPSNRISAS